MDFDSNDVDFEIAQGEALAQKILKRNELLRSLRQISNEIATMMVASPAKLPIPETVDEGSNQANPSEVHVKPRVRSKTTLIGYIMGALSSASEGLTKSEIAKSIFDAGYETNSEHPDSMIYQALRTLQMRKAIFLSSNNRYFLTKAGV
jgi:hypothetical protein